VSRTNATLGGVLLLVLGLAACTASHKGASAAGSPAAGRPALAARIYQVTMSTNSADFRLATAITGSNHAAGLSSTAVGSYSWAAGEGTFTVHGTDPGLYELTSQVVVDGKHEYSKIVSKSGPVSNSILSGSGMSSENGWTESTLSGGTSASLQNLLSQGLEDMFAMDTQPDAVDPASLLTVLQSESGVATDAGRVTLDGVATTHYRTMVPISKLGLAGGLGASALTVNYWVDTGYRLRQLQMTFTVPAQPGQSQSPAAPAGGSSGPGTAPMYAVGSGTPEKFPLTFSETLQLSNYGASAQVAVPPPGQVTGHESCTVSSSGDNCQSS